MVTLQACNAAGSVAFRSLRQLFFSTLSREPLQCECTLVEIGRDEMGTPKRHLNRLVPENVRHDLLVVAETDVRPKRRKLEEVYVSAYLPSSRTAKPLATFQPRSPITFHVFDVKE